MDVFSGKFASVFFYVVHTIGLAQNGHPLAAAGAGNIRCGHGERQGHAAQGDVVGFGLLIVAKGAVSIAPAHRTGVEGLILIDHLSHGRVIRRFALRERGGKVAVSEAVLQLLPQYLVAVLVLFNLIQLEDRIVAVIVLADGKGVVKGRSIHHMERQSPCVLGEVLVIHRGPDPVHIVSRLTLQDDAGCTRVPIPLFLIQVREVFHFTPGLSAIGRPLVVKALRVSQRAIFLVIPENLSEVQIAHHIAHSGLHRVLCRRRNALDKRGNFCAAVIRPSRGRGPQQGEDHYQRHEQ